MSAGPGASPRVAVIVVAAGAGTRLGANRPKALVEVRGVPLVRHAVLAALATPGLAQVVVVAPPGHEGAISDAVSGRDPALVSSGIGPRVVTGGAERPDSVRAGLAHLDDTVDVVLVHDAARGLQPAPVFARVRDAVLAHGCAVVPVVPVVDTVKLVDAVDLVVSTPDRRALRAVQTPQGFPRSVLQAVHDCPGEASVTDDAGMVEAAGLPVRVIAGDPRGAKVTTPEDLTSAAPLLVVVSGLPGTGKTTLARSLAAARAGSMAHLRMDSAEQAMRAAGVSEIGVAGYGVVQAMAADLLATGVDVVVDAVNPVPEAREAWRAVGERAGARTVEVELVNGDAAEHERRVRERVADIPGHRVPTWDDVGRTASAYEPGDLTTTATTVIDVAGLDPAAVLRLLEEVLP